MSGGSKITSFTVVVKMKTSKYYERNLMKSRARGLTLTYTLYSVLSMDGVKTKS